MALAWCRDENGMRVHGTTGEKPREVFLEREQIALQPLPDSPFELATWKQVSVHPDQYIQFEKKAYSVPERYFPDSVIAGAILDRLAHHAHQIQFKGESIRKKLGRAALKNALDSNPQSS
jgi:hypothetical protein